MRTKQRKRMHVIGETEDTAQEKNKVVSPNNCALDTGAIGQKAPEEIPLKR